MTPAGPSPAMLARATSSASSLTSVIHTVVPTVGSSYANARPIAPDPVPRSAITRVGPTSDAFSSAASATSSVSGRGIRTRRSTASVMRRNAHSPSTYCNGSPSRSRASIASRWLTMRTVAGSSRRARNSSPSTDPEATSHSHRAWARSPIASAVSAHSSRHETVAFAHAPSARSRARSSAARASTTTCRSPARIAARRYTVKPMRWSVTRFSL